MEIPSSSNTKRFDFDLFDYLDGNSSTISTSCFDFALYDYLHSHHISSSTGTSCFDFALDILVELDELKTFSHWGIHYLEKKVALLEAFFLCFRKCTKRRNREALLEHDQEDEGNIMSESLKRNIICFRIQDVAIRMIHDLGSALLDHKHFGDTYILQLAVTRSLKNIELFLETDFKKYCTIVFDCYSPGDPQLLMKLIILLFATVASQFNFERQELMSTIIQKLMLLSNLIGFATMRGVECTQLTDLLTQVAGVAARLISASQFGGGDFSVSEQKVSEILQLIHKKVIPPDPQILETYIHVLTASKKQSRSSYALALEENKYPVVVSFIDSLHDHLVDLLGSYASFEVPHQLLKLYQGVRYLKVVLKKEEKLGDEIKDLVGLVLCDAGIMIFSLSVNEIKEYLPKEIDLWLFHLHKILKYIMAEVGYNYPLTSPYSSFNYPRSNELGCMDFFLENLKHLARCVEADDSIVFLSDRIQMVQKDLVFLRSFLENIKEQRHQSGELQAFWSHVMEDAYKAELLIDSIVVGDKCEDSLDAVARDINLLKIEALEIHNGQTQRISKTSIRIPSLLTAAIHNEDLVGLDDAVEAITHRLTRGSKQLDVVPIVGMPGLGKTTLANKVYSTPSVRSHFHVRGWCCVSQTYGMHSLLAQLLCSISSRSPDEYLENDENDLAMKLKQVLLRTRYLLVLDDLWGIEAWNLLEKILPDDVNGSRILFTSRFQNLSSQFKLDSMPYHLPQLTDEESWTLLQKKLFDKKGCPPELSEVGSQIAKACRGLPLTVVLVAGILATTAQDSWEEVSKSLSSIVLDDKYCMKTLELSYSQLPDYLKPCLLYFGAFPEDEVINVRRLLWLWISEGFVQQTEGRRLEEAAYDSLMALINRSLVMVTRQRTVGGAQACRLHDLIHEFCVEKAKEQGFLHTIHGSKDPFSLTRPSNPYRVCAHNNWELKIWELMLIFPNLRCLLLSHKKREEDLEVLLPKLLRVLDFGYSIFHKLFPMEVVLLVHLRYLALRGVIKSIPSAIANLSRLQTLIIDYPRGPILLPDTGLISLPNTIWNIKTLSHLRTTDHTRGFVFPVGNHEVSPDLDHLDTLNLAIDPSSQSLQRILTKLPSICRLKCMKISDSRETTRYRDKILVFDCLIQLESLYLTDFEGYRFKFPLNLKKLTLLRNSQPWSEISTIGMLPNLEVLKLFGDSFVGEEWVMEEGEFPNLRVLQLLWLDIRNWTAFSNNFSGLEKLVVDRCENLEEVPSCLGECPTLEKIKVARCRKSVANSVKQIQQEQKDLGNEDLMVVIEN